MQQEQNLNKVSKKLYERSRQYFRHISKPEASRRSCSRLSPYLLGLPECAAGVTGTP
jgi:hypothetical protein